ncbi:MAG: hypothetical protein ACXWRE_03385 [Pseudobdellovibrionaceae bacterium]
MFFGAFGFLKSDLATLNVCRASQLQIQGKAGKNLSKLLHLNSRALGLRLSQAHAEKAMAAALESGLPPAIAAAEAYQLKVKMQRQALDLKQKTLLQTANTWLAFGGVELQRELLHEWSLQSSPLKFWMQSSLHLAQAKVPKLAVIPDLPEVAPIYQLSPHFEEAQAWDQSWNLEFKTVSWMKNFLNIQERFQRSCTTSLYLDAGTDQWIAKFKGDRSLLKGFF